MHNISVFYLSDMPHSSQILTGFHLLGKKSGYAVTINSGLSGAFGLAPFPAAVLVLYRGKKLLYDTADGYHDPEQMKNLLENCDFYFKRSFSSEMNQQFFPHDAHKVYPLGFNYHVTYPGSPLNIYKTLRRRIRAYLTPCFTPKAFEGKPMHADSPCRILFYTRLWPQSPDLSDRMNSELNKINATRIDILRRLKQKFGNSLWGGVEDSPVARALCPDLILPRKATRRYAYLQRLHRSHICIGSTGLHGSIGWKTGEYIAAAKAVVCEKPVYSVPGQLPFLTYETAEECIQAVERLVSDPSLRRRMQEEGQQYYQTHLRPEQMIANTLNIVDASMDAYPHRRFSLSKRSCLKMNETALFRQKQL